ncbi:MAG: hypothetical protein OEY59_06400 [Deltaproteobacteria bacterium]|nr:hypothetical protein [Deltaproteobacteria bacterium]
MKIKNEIKWFWVFLGLILFILPNASAKSLEEAIEEAALSLKNSSSELSQKRPFVIKIVNTHNQREDQTSKKIQAELYQMLEKHLPQLDLISSQDSLSGVSETRVLFVKGEYEQVGDQIKLRIKVLRKIDGSIISQASVMYEAVKKSRKTLVAVLDLEAEHLSRIEKKAYSDIFRNSLNKLNVFDLASSADIDKMNPDAIQKQLGCTRDECATIIGEQLGVDRVISTTLFKLGRDSILSAKMMDIKDGSILASETFKFNDNQMAIDIALEEIGYKLAGRTKEVLVEASSSAPSNLVWHIAASSLTLAAAVLANTEASVYNDLDKTNQTLKQQAITLNDKTNKTTSDETTFQNLSLEFETNKEELKKRKSNIQTFNALTVLFLAWEGYLIFYGGETEGSAGLNHGSDWMPQIQLSQNNRVSPEMAVNFRWNW